MDPAEMYSVAIRDGMIALFVVSIVFHIWIFADKRRRRFWNFAEYLWLLVATLGIFSAAATFGSDVASWSNELAQTRAQFAAETVASQARDQSRFLHTWRARETAEPETITVLDSLADWFDQLAAHVEVGANEMIDVSDYAPSGTQSTRVLDLVDKLPSQLQPTLDWPVADLLSKLEELVVPALETRDEWAGWKMRTVHYQISPWMTILLGMAIGLRFSIVTAKLKNRTPLASASHPERKP